MRLLILIFSLLLITSCATVAKEKQCVVNEDCVPATCCHAKDAVNKNFKPTDCTTTMCSSNCVEGTIDCGQGLIQCIKGECKVILND